MSVYLINESDMVGIADAVRAKTGKSEKISFDDIVSEIAGISTSVDLNFDVVGGTEEPGNPSENMILVNTDVEITSWHFGAEEPNVYDIQPINVADPWRLVAPHSLREGDILNFTIPANVTSTYEAIRIFDPNTGKEYCVRQFDGSAVDAWVSGIKVCVIISNETYKIGDWVCHGTARLLKWESYYHEEGTVWIETGTHSSIAFNALKKNGITIYPMSVKQYVSGAWVDKTAKSYQNGEWVDWYVFTYLFSSSLNKMTAVGCSKKDTLPSVSGDVYSLAFTDSLTHWTNSTYFRSDEMIDLSRINTLYIKFKSLTTSDYGKIAVSLTTNAYSGKQTDVSDTKLVALGNAAIASVNVRPNDNVWAVDLSSYNTLMYIYIGAYSGFDTMPGSSYSNTRNGSVACEIEEVYY